jgi:sodium/potassium/calcium exchanger 6
MIAGVFPLVILLMLCGAVVSFILFWFVFLRRNAPPPYFLPFLVIGTFIMSVFWLYIVTNEMLALIQSFGTAWGILPSVLAITALTWGNSLGDIVADVAVAREGYPSMAVGACYGGPLLNLLLGIGFAFTFNPTQLQQYCVVVESDAVVTVSFLCLIAILLLTSVVIPLCRFRSMKWFGVLLILFYVVYLTLAFLAAFFAPVREALTWSVGRACLGPL